MTGKIGHNRNAIAPLRTLLETCNERTAQAVTMSDFRKKHQHSGQCVNYTFKQEE
jgi:hypothetical protein